GRRSRGCSPGDRILPASAVQELKNVAGAMHLFAASRRAEASEAQTSVRRSRIAPDVNAVDAAARAGVVVQPVDDRGEPALSAHHPEVHALAVHAGRRDHPAETTLEARGAGPEAFQRLLVRWSKAA